MLNLYKKQNDALVEFRIKAHLRSYLKDPLNIDDDLMQDAIEKLKKIPYEDKDPTDSVVVELILDAYRMGALKYNDLTMEGCRLVRNSKHRRHHSPNNDRVYQNQILRNLYQ